MSKYLGDNNQNTSLNKNSYYKKFLYFINDKKKKYDEYYLK